MQLFTKVPAHSRCRPEFSSRAGRRMGEEFAEDVTVFNFPAYKSEAAKWAQARGDYPLLLTHQVCASICKHSMLRQSFVFILDHHAVFESSLGLGVGSVGGAVGGVLLMWQCVGLNPAWGLQLWYCSLVPLSEDALVESEWLLASLCPPPQTWMGSSPLRAWCIHYN